MYLVGVAGVRRGKDAVFQPTGSHYKLACSRRRTHIVRHILVAKIPWETLEKSWIHSEKTHWTAAAPPITHFYCRGVGLAGTCAHDHHGWKGRIKIIHSLCGPCLFGSMSKLTRSWPKKSMTWSSQNANTRGFWCGFTKYRFGSRTKKNIGGKAIPGSTGEKATAVVD